MGRWAQRQRGGGGAGVVLAEMIGANYASASIVTVAYNKVVDATDFAGNEFQTIPGGDPSATVSQSSPSTLDVDFGADVHTNTQITLFIPVAGYKYPDTTNIT